MALKFYCSVAKGKKRKVRQFLRLILALGEVTGKKLLGKAPFQWLILSLVKRLLFVANKATNLIFFGFNFCFTIMLFC